MANSAGKIEPGSVCRVPYATAGFGGALLSDFARNAPNAQPFFPPRNWRDVIAECALKQYPRAELSKTLEAAGRELSAPEASIENARLLAQNTTYAVITGQQGGFLGGPLLTLHKALTAVKLARQYDQEAAGAARFVPVFWVAGDDHDFGEIDHAYFLRDDGTAQRVHAPLNDTQKGCSASDLNLSNDTDALLALSDELETLGGKNVAAEWLNAYASKTFESAFATLLLKALGHTGLIVARSSDLRRFSGEILARNLNDFETVSRLVQDSGEAMRAQAYEPGFDKLRVAPHFFVAEKAGGLRGSIHVETRESETAFIIRGETERTLSRAELHAVLEQSPELFTPSAPLRPIVQQSIFPVAAAILGPGEMAYWAQLRDVHANYGAVWPVIVPRATLTLIDPAGEKAARKLGLTDDPFALFLSKDELTRRASAGGELARKIAARTAALLSEFDAMRGEISAVGAGVDPMLEKLREKFAYELARVAEKTAAALDKSGDAKIARAAYLSGLVRPKNEPQERVLCWAQFIVKFPDLPDRLLAIIEPGAREHFVVTL